MAVVVVVVVVVGAVVVIVAVLVLAQALARRGVHGSPGGPLPVEAVLGLASGADAEEAAQPEAPPGGTTAVGTVDGVGHR